jgi:hypothetical protein
MWSGHDIICGGCGKKLRMFWRLWHVRFLETGTSQEKFLRIWTNVIRFDVLEKIQIWIRLTNFSISNIQHNYCHVIFWNNFKFVCYFNNYFWIKISVRLSAKACWASRPMKVSQPTVYNPAWEYSPCSYARLRTWRPKPGTIRTYINSEYILALLVQ